MEWNEVEVERTYRGAVYQIKIVRGGDQIKVNGKVIEGNVLPIFNDGQVLVVEMI